LPESERLPYLKTCETNEAIKEKISFEIDDDGKELSPNNRKDN
jgi:hypothetical protein